MTKPILYIDELLDDPMIKLVMARDGWKGDDVRLLLQRARPASREPVVPPAHVVAHECLRQWACR